MKFFNSRSILPIICGVAITTASGSSYGQDMAAAEATLHGIDGGEVGSVNLTQGPHGLLLKADLHGLPAGTLAFHFHTTGSCSTEFKAAGGHLNPTGKKHGFMSAEGSHLGDMPNIHVPDSGRLKFELFLAGMTLGEGSSPLLDADGTSVMIHKQADDYRTDPAGAAGDRIACGVIQGK